MAKLDKPEYDVQDVLNAVRCAFYAEHKRACDKNVDVEVTELMVSKPVCMPDWMRKWLKNLPPTENESLLWMAQFV